uniref:KIAA1549 like n=1 Tax=Amphiprion ocellaris TaxID=80972 RepID=A0AAQ5ZLU9_AMPOC
MVSDLSTHRQPQGRIFKCPPPSSLWTHDETAGRPCFLPRFTHEDRSDVLFTSETSATYPLDMATGVRSGRTGHPGADPGGCSPLRTDAGGAGRCLRTGLRAGAAGMLANCLLSVAVLLLLVRCALAAEEKPTYDASGSSPSPSDSAVTGAPAHPLANLSMAEEVPFKVVHSDGDSDSEGEGLSGQPAFSSVLTVMAGTVKHPVSLDQSRTLPTFARDETQTTQWPSRSSSQGSDTSSSSSHVGDRILPASSEAEMDELTAGTSRELSFPKEKEASLAPSQSVRIPLSAGPTERTSQVSPLTPRQDTTTASVKLTTTTVASTTKAEIPTTTMPSPRVTTLWITTTTTTTPHPATVTRRTTTTTTRTQTSRRVFTPPIPRTSPSRGVTTVLISPFTTTTEAPPQQCNITERLWVKTVVSIYVRRNRLDSIQRQNLRRGLSQGLRKALNDTSAQAQVETVFGSPNMTVAYHVTGGDLVYPPSVVLEALASYGRDKLIADLRQYLPMVTALPLPVALWRTSPAAGFQLKTVLQFVGADDDPRSCRFSQMMEQRLEKVFSEAQAKVLNVNSRLSVQILSVSQAAGSPAVSLVYTVKNGTVFLNGTAASNLLGQLSAELVGYFLFYPPLIIAEPLEYHNLNTSIATRDFWVVTVIQDVDNGSLEGQYQSFASLMEQRLAELFVLAGQQGTRFRRATTVGSYTVQMVSIRRVSGLKNPAEMTYYVQHNGIPLSGTSAAKVLNTVDSQTMALTLGYFVQLQAEPVVKNPPNNLWIIAAVLAPISVVTLIIIIITAVLCRKNKNDFKADAIGNLNPRAKPVQGFDYAKQHLGQQGGDEETLPVSQDTLVMSLQIRDTPLSLEKALQQDGTASKKRSRSTRRKPTEDGSVISNESEKLNSGRGLTVPKVTAQQKLTKEETRKRDGESCTLFVSELLLCSSDPYDTSSGSLQLISIKPMAAQTNYSHPATSDRSQDSAIVNGEVNLALKQKSDIEHYRNKLRLKAKRKGYYDFPSTNGSSSVRALTQRQRHDHERAAGEHGRPLEPDDERGSTYVKSHRRHSQVGQTAYRSRQSLSSPSPGGTEMDLLVMRERPRRGIRNSGYDTEPELIEETNVDRLLGPQGYMYGRGLKGHSETSTLSSQPSIDEVRQQMHLLLEEAFSLASGGQSTSGSPAPPPLPYADVVTSAPGTMSCGRGGLQWVPSYGADVYQCSLPKPAFRFTQLPEMAMGSPPPLPPRTGPPPGTSLRRSTSDLGPKGRSSETSLERINPLKDTVSQSMSLLLVFSTGNPITAVYAIPATRAGYSEYFVSTPPTSYHSPSWMSYPPEPEDVPPQWADSMPLPGYVEAFPHPRYPQGSPTRLPLQYNQTLEQPSTAPSTASQQSLPQVLKDMDSMPLSSLSTSALVQAIRQEVAKLAKKQNDMFEF